MLYNFDTKFMPLTDGADQSFRNRRLMVNSFVPISLTFNQNSVKLIRFRPLSDEKKKASSQYVSELKYL